MLVPFRSLAAGLLSLTLAAGCALPGHVKAVKTADRLTALQSSLEELQSRVTATSTALADLIAKKDQDASQSFSHLEASVHALEGAQKRAAERLTGVREEAEEYFVTWKQQAATISDEDLKEQSEERRAELASAVERVSDAITPAREAIDTHLATFHDTLKYLSIDLTPSGIASIEDRSKSASKSAKSIHSKLDAALESVREVAPMFARARASTPKLDTGTAVSSD